MKKSELFGSRIIDVQTNIVYSPASYINNIRSVSISGVQEKMFAVLDHHTIRLAKPGEQSQYIIKPAPMDKLLARRNDMPINEYVTMRIASGVYGIKTAANGLIFLADGHIAYIVKRFDIKADKSKRYQEDFCSILQKTATKNGKNYKYDGSYLKIAVAIRRFIPTWRFEMPKFFSLVLFNYLFSNGDAHLKNFSVYQNEDGLLTLTPAYDLLNTSLHINDEDFALQEGLGITEKSDTYIHTGHPTITDFVQFGKECGMTDRQIITTIAPFMKNQEAVYLICNESEMTEKSRRIYLRSYERRLAFLQRDCSALHGE